MPGLPSTVIFMFGSTKMGKLCTLCEFNRDSGLYVYNF